MIVTLTDWFTGMAIVMGFVVMFAITLLVAEWVIILTVISVRIYNRFRGTEKRTTLPPYITKE